MSLITGKQNWAVECSEKINKQINVELDASHQYLSLYCFFNQDTIALDGVARFFKKSSDEEREHALKLIEYQNKRGEKVVLENIKDYNHSFTNQKTKSDVLQAFKLVLDLEKTVNQHLLDLHTVAENNNDPQFCDFLESEFLNEQVDAINEITKYVNQLTRKGCDGHGVWEFNNKLK